MRNVPAELLARLRARNKAWAHLPFTMLVMKLHDATNLHMDLRILVNGTLVSWAMAVGPSRTKGICRRAVKVGNHNPEWALLERRIQKGKYGAGPSIVWDLAYVIHITVVGGEIISIEQALKNGYVEIWIEGIRLQGGFSLRRMGDTDEWVMTKLDDEEAKAEFARDLRYDTSVISGQTLEEVDRPSKAQLSFDLQLDESFPASESELQEWMHRNSREA